MHAGPREWDAEHLRARLRPASGVGGGGARAAALGGDETVLDAGCGSGRVTAELVERLPEGKRDRGRRLRGDGRRRCASGCADATSRSSADLTELELDEPVDAIFSTAIFHWILDHDALFARLRAALRPGGRLVAQCGGEGNVAEHPAALAEVVAARAVRRALRAGFEDRWNFADAEETEERLRAAGFAEVALLAASRAGRPRRTRARSCAR